MAYEQRDNSGSLFKNEGDRKRENGPEYSGKCMVGGTMYYFDAWLKRPEGKKAFMSFSFKPVDERSAPTDTRTHAEQRRPARYEEELPPF